MGLNLCWNKEIKTFTVLFAVLLLVGGLGSNLIIDGYCNGVNREFKLAVASMLNSVKDAYPEVPEDELLLVLSGGSDSAVGEKLIGQYGVFIEERGSYFTGLKKQESAFRRVLTFVLLSMGGGYLAVILFYLRHRQREIGKLCSYMDEVQKGNFSLAVAANREDEFSGLRNELYKLTVFLKEQARQAADNRKALADALADISHQLKTPLTSITVLVDNLAENGDMEQSVRSRFLGEISRQLSGMSWLIATLLKLSRLDAGVVELECESVSVEVLTENVFRKLSLSAEWRHVTLKSVISGRIWIKGDERWLTEAFLNLVKNAVEHSKAGGEVLVSAEENDVYTLITVKNHGERISPEEQRHLFQRFYRGRSGGEDGVGIGLALAKEIIVRQGGYITVESGEGNGTVFSVKFIKCH